MKEALIAAGVVVVLLVLWRFPMLALSIFPWNGEVRGQDEDSKKRGTE